jgi:hypothetical protein
MAAKIEANLSSCKVEPFYAPRAKVDTKPKIVHNVEPIQDTSAPWARLEEAINDLTKNQTLMMNIITNLERAHNKPPSLLLGDNLKILAKHGELGLQMNKGFQIL